MTDINHTLKGMTKQELYNLFNSFNDYCEFDQITLKLASRPDVHAMIVFDRLLPSAEILTPLIHCVKNSTVWFTIKSEDFIEVANVDIVHDLVRCGVGYDLNHDCFSFITASDFS